MSKAIMDADEILQHASPITHQQGHEIQPWGHLVRMPIALAESACRESVENLNQLLVDTLARRSISCTYCSTSTYGEQSKLIDAIAERIQLLGRISVAMRMTWPRPPSSLDRQGGENRYLSNSLACCTRTTSC